MTGGDSVWQFIAYFKFYALYFPGGSDFKGKLLKD